jgi:hypothetical protein
MASWIDEEISGSKFKDQRLTQRFRSILSALSSGDGQSIPQLCDDWAMTKATYRFLSNNRVEEYEILEGHFSQTSKRIRATSGPALILHDTCEFSYKREDPERMGFTRKGTVLSTIRSGKKQEYKVCGVLMHASLAVTSEGLPMGLTSARFWTRTEFKNTSQMKRHINPTRIPIEEKESIKWLQNLQATNDILKTDPSKCIHIGDRECDIYEFFCQCIEVKTYFIIRTCVNRLADESTVSEILAVHGKGYVHKVSFVDGDGEAHEARLNVKVKKMKLHPPIGKEKYYPDIEAFVISAVEEDPPASREPIRWNFITNLPITCRQEAIQTIEWYKHRWKIENYFKIIKSGFKAEESRLQTADRIAKLISIFCILAWRVHWITYLGREGQNISPSIAFDRVEQKIISAYFKKGEKLSSLNDYVIHLAKLGGYLGRAGDSPPGNMVIWRGLRRLNDLRDGFELNCG